MSSRAPKVAGRSKCKHPKLDKSLHCKDCGEQVDIREKRNKYGARRTDGFDSAKEARRYQDLKLLQKAGEISGLKLQPRFKLEVNGHLVCEYRGDFGYLSDYENGYEQIVEDVKSEATKTPAYQLKKKLMLAIHGIAIREV